MPPPSQCPRPLLFGTCLFAALAATAAEPLPDPDNGAISGTFHFPDSTEGTSLVPKGRNAFSMHAITSSHSTNDDTGTEALTLDGETTRAEFRYRYGLSERLEVGLRLPYVWHESGSLDSLIENWHHTFGMPSGGRDGRDNDQLEFSYRDTTGTQFDYQRNSNGIGDLRLIAGWRLTEGPNHRSALRFGLKLPTGDSDTLHGSGGTDVSIGIAGDWKQLFGYSRLSGFYRAHATFVGEPDLLPERYNDIIGQFSTGAGFQLTRSIDLRLQAVTRSATHDSTIEILGQAAAWITFGGNIRLSDSYEFNVAVTEDINVRSAPDVSFLIGLRYNPESEAGNE
ncbi:MAG: DUF3187 family protein [Woeseiaceae bacterium]